MRIKRVLITAMIGILFLYLTACGKDDASRLQSSSVQLAIVNCKPGLKPFSDVRFKSLCYSLGKSSCNNFVQSQLIGGSENECFTYFMRIRNECN